MHTRRTFLASLGTLSVAGCTAPVVGNTAPETAGFLELRSVQSSDSDRLAFDASVTRNRVTPEEPPHVLLTLTNQRGRETTATCGAFDVFSARESLQSNPGLALISGKHDGKPVRQSCWQAKHPIYRPGIQGTRFQPYESKSVELEVWGASDTEDAVCLPTGTYDFREYYYVYESSNDIPREPSFTAGFRVELSPVS